MRSRLSQLILIAIILTFSLSAGYARAGDPLVALAKQGDTAGVKAMIESDAYTSDRNNDNVQDALEALNDALTAASMNGHDDIVKILLKSPTRIDHRSTFINTSGRNSSELYEMYDHTPLTGASMNNHTSTVKILLKAGADINANGPEHSPSLLIASKEGHKKLVKVLIKAGADVNKSGDRYDQTPLIAASGGGRNDIVETLLSAGANINTRDRDGDTALFAASRNGHSDTVEILISAGADVNAKTNDGVTALSAAKKRDSRSSKAEDDRKDVIRLLIEAGAK